MLLHIARQLYPDIPAVYVDTGLEFPEIRSFVLQHNNVEILKPKKNFRQVISDYGYPMISKEVSSNVYGARKYMRKLLEYEAEGRTPETMKYSYAMADMLGIDRRADRNNEWYQKLLHGEIPSDVIRTPVRYLIMHGQYIHTEKGVPTNEYSKMYDKSRYKFFLEAPFELSSNCCSTMKKAPLKSYAKKYNKVPMTAQMASESRLRTTN